MNTFKLKLTSMAHGGTALGRDKKNHVVFVPFAIPGETVRVTAADTQKKYVYAYPLEILNPSAERVAPRCDHFELGCCSHFQHIAYEAQLKYKREIVEDQLKRVGGIKFKVPAVTPSPVKWEYQHEITLNSTSQGTLGLWSPFEEQVVPITDCALLAPPLQNLLADFELQHPSLRKVTLRLAVMMSCWLRFKRKGSSRPNCLSIFPCRSPSCYPTARPRI